MKLNNLRIKTKILLPLSVAGILLGVGLYFYFSGQYRAAQQEALLNKARAVIMSAEAAREYAALQLEHKVFKPDMKELKDVLLTVPIVSAMEVARKKSKELGYILKVPKVSPRNPDNQPDELELRVLSLLEDKTKKEHFEVDEKNNQLRMFRPIALTAECMDCHGDPANSQKLWGRADGKDITGVQM